jgi:RNA polymerase-binding transcription factor DksA
MLPKQFTEEMKAELLKNKKRLEEDLANLKPHTEMGGDLDSNVQEIEEDELNQDLMTRINSDLEKISKALKKIEQGTYGSDDEGKEISEKRLRALPWADKAI